MPEVHIFSACLLAFGAVFILLTLLAAVMQLLVTVFREPEARVDPSVVAAISTTVSTLIPGARVTRIEEE